MGSDVIVNEGPCSGPLPPSEQVQQANLGHRTHLMWYSYHKAILSGTRQSCKELNLPCTAAYVCRQLTKPSQPPRHTLSSSQSSGGLSVEGVNTGGHLPWGVLAARLKLGHHASQGPPAAHGILSPSPLVQNSPPASCKGQHRNYSLTIIYIYVYIIYIFINISIYSIF